MNRQLEFFILGATINLVVSKTALLFPLKEIAIETKNHLTDARESFRRVFKHFQTEQKHCQQTGNTSQHRDIIKEWCRTPDEPVE